MTQSQLAKMKLQVTSKELEKMKMDKEKLLKQLNGVSKTTTTIPSSPRSRPLASLDNRPDLMKQSPRKNVTSFNRPRPTENALGEQEDAPECAQQ